MRDTPQIMTMGNCGACLKPSRQLKPLRRLLFGGAKSATPTSPKSTSFPSSFGRVEDDPYGTATGSVAEFALTLPWLIVKLAVPAAMPLGTVKLIWYSPIPPGVKPANATCAV